jgi:hypothetical protein
MPTYINNGTTSYSVRNTDGDMVTVKHGETVATYDVPDTGLTKTLDTPYYNPIVALHEVTASTAEDKTVTLSAQSAFKRLRIQKIATATISVYFTSKSNTPAVLKSWTATDPIVDIVVDHTVATLVIEFSAAGSCQVVELRE